MTEPTCPRCDRLLRPWPLKRGNRCSPKDWVNCIRNDDEAMRIVGEAVLADHRSQQDVPTC